MQINIFVINLERCIEKRRKMEDRLKGLDYTIVTGVDGRELNEEKLINMNASVLTDWKDPHSGRNVTWGEVGCALSHYNIFEKCVNENIDIAIIFEDD